MSDTAADILEQFLIVIIVTFHDEFSGSFLYFLVIYWVILLLIFVL